jgi:hypothetical protein
MKAEPDNCTPPTARPVPGWISIASSSPASRPFVLTTLRALRLDPGCGCRTPKNAGNDQKNGHNNPQPRLDQFGRFRDDPVA